MESFMRARQVEGTGGRGGAVATARAIAVGGGGGDGDDSDEEVYRTAAAIDAANSKGTSQKKS